jgi:hypothetical protein
VGRGRERVASGRRARPLSLGSPRAVPKLGTAGRGEREGSAAPPGPGDPRALRPIFQPAAHAERVSPRMARGDLVGLGRGDRGGRC